MILEHRVFVLNQPLCSIVRDFLGEPLVRGNNLKELVREIIFGPLVVVLDDRGAHLRRRDREDGANHPVGPAPEAVEAHEIDVLVRDTAEEAEDILDFEHLSHLFRLGGDTRITRHGHICPLGRDAGNPVPRETVRLHGPTPVFRILATAGDVIAEAEDRAETGLRRPLRNPLVKLLVDEELRAADTDTVENIENILEELDEIDRAREFVVTEMTRAAVICLSTTAACLPIVENTHARVKETSNTGLISIVGSTVRDLHDRTVFNLFRAENPELDTHHGLDIRIWTVHTSGHLFSVR